MDTLKLKTWTLYWLITAMFVIPAVLLAVFAFLVLVMPQGPADELSDILVQFAHGLSNWRRNTCEDFYRFRKNGYRLTIE